MRTEKLDCGCILKSFEDHTGCFLDEINCKKHRKEQKEAEERAKKFAEKNPTTKHLTVRGE